MNSIQTIHPFFQPRSESVGEYTRKGKTDVLKTMKNNDSEELKTEKGCRILEQLTHWLYTERERVNPDPSTVQILSTPPMWHPLRSRSQAPHHTHHIVCAIHVVLPSTTAICGLISFGNVSNHAIKYRWCTANLTSTQTWLGNRRNSLCLAAPTLRLFYFLFLLPFFLPLSNVVSATFRRGVSSIK